MKKRILVIEEVELNIDLLVQLLEDRYEILAARDGESGVAMTIQERPDLILMDLSLPVIDGWEATRRIKADPRLSHIPIIALTARTMKEDQERAMASGCDGWLVKPLDEDLLFETLERWLAEE